MLSRVFIAAGLFIGASAFTIGPSTVGPDFLKSGAVSAVAGGPIVLDGMDPVCHSGYEGTGGYIAQVLKRAHDGANNLNNGKIAILGAQGVTNSCGGDWNTLLTEQYLALFSTQPAVDFYNTEASVVTFFDSVIFSDTPAVIWLPDNWSRSSQVESVFTANAEKIADFVNSGGALFANMGSYGWLTALLPSAVYNNGGCNGGPDATADGSTDFGLTNEMVAACWHGFFTGDVGTLKVLVDYPYPSPSDPRVAVSVGGGSVSLPSSFTLAISPANPRAGEDLVITATAQTLAGVPQEGVVVTVTVSSGPDAGQTLTATTDTNGIATITVRTNTTGTAVYTATATVNGVAKTVSATVEWVEPTTTTETPTTTTEAPAPAPTTTEAPTTTTEAPTTTTEAPTTTTEAPVPAPTTTEAPAVTPAPTVTEPPVAQPTDTIVVHDHSTHDHGPKLPATGSSQSRMMLWISALLIAIGLHLSTLNTLASRRK